MGAIGMDDESAARAAGGGRWANIRLVQSRAEDFDDPDGFDIVTAGASLHWTDPAALFPKLARRTGLIAVLNNDPVFPAPPPPCGQEAWVDFLTTWYARTGRQAPASSGRCESGRARAARPARGLDRRRRPAAARVHPPNRASRTSSPAATRASAGTAGGWARLSSGSSTGRWARSCARSPAAACSSSTSSPS